MEIRSNPLLAIVGNPGPSGRDETILCEQCGSLIYRGTPGHGIVKGRCPFHGGSWQKTMAEHYPRRPGLGGGRRGAGQASKMNPLGAIYYYPVKRGGALIGVMQADDGLDALRSAEEEFGVGVNLGVAYSSLKALIAREGHPPASPIPAKRISYYSEGGPLYGRNPLTYEEAMEIERRRDEAYRHMEYGRLNCYEEMLGEFGSPARQNPAWEEELDIAEAQLALAERRKGSVASSKSHGKVKSKGRKVRGNPHEQKKRRPKVTRYSLEEARRKFRGLDAAIKKFKRFHGAGSNPDHVDVYHLTDGRDEERVENVHTALHRTLETPYVVPWKSNKKGTLWLHEHPEGDGAPLEVLDPETGTTRKIAGDFVVDGWWES